MKVKVVDSRGKVHWIPKEALQPSSRRVRATQVHIHIHIHGTSGSGGSGAGNVGYDSAGYSGYGDDAGYSSYDVGYAGYGAVGYSTSAGKKKQPKRPRRKAAKNTR